MGEPIRSFSFGGGWQSTAALVLAARGELDYRTFLMANVGDDSENPATLRYVADHAAPFAAAHGLELLVLDRIMVRSGEHRTLYSEITRPGSRAQKIPVRLSNGKPGSRSCTVDYKIRVVGQELKRRGATAGRPCRVHRRTSSERITCDAAVPQADCLNCLQPNVATVGIGITLDEIGRANTRTKLPYERIEYPLLERGIRRADCARIIRDAGLPLPPKSSCWFCPFHSLAAWHEMRRTEPELFERSCQLEELLNARQAAAGKKPVYLTDELRPLREAVPDGVDLLPLADDDDPGCDSGWCMT